MKDVWQLGSSCVRDLGLYAVIIANDEMLNGEADDISAVDGISQIHNKGLHFIFGHIYRIRVACNAYSRVTEVRLLAGNHNLTKN